MVGEEEEKDGNWRDGEKLWDEVSHFKWEIEIDCQGKLKKLLSKQLGQAPLCARNWWP